MQRKIFTCVILVIVILLSLTGCGSTDLQALAKDLNTYTMDIVYNEDHTLTVEQTVEYTNQTDVVLDRLCFHLYANAFRNEDSILKPVSSYNKLRAYPNGFSSGSIDISKVYVTRNTVQFATGGAENNILIVPLTDAIYPNESVEVRMEYTVTIPNVYHRFGYGEQTINLGNFYPIACVYEDGDFVQDGYHANGDPFYSDMANYDVTISYPNTLMLASTGESVMSVEKNGKIIQRIEASVVRDFAVVLCDQWLCKSQEVNGTTFNYYYYKDENSDTTFQAMIDAVTTFESLLGDYPYSTLTAVQANFIHGGMEYPNLILISDDIELKNEIIQVTVHEIGHQWFYNLVGNNEVKEAWLDEALTEYITAMFFEINTTYEVSFTDICANYLNSYQLFVDVYTEVFGEVDTSMNRTLSQFNSEPEYTYLVYVKGFLMLNNIRTILGDSVFCLGLRTYFENNKYDIATTADFISAFQKASHKDVQGIINSWLEGNVII